MMLRVDKILTKFNCCPENNLLMNSLKLSNNKQVFCITHLPQIASKAKNHLYVYKEVSKSKTRVIAKYLNEKDKINAIAELYGNNPEAYVSISAAKGSSSETYG